MAISAIKGLSALIYLLGCLAMICGAIWAVMVELVAIAQSYGPGFGLGALVAAIWMCCQYSEVIARPFRLWTALWVGVDDMIRKQD